MVLFSYSALCSAVLIILYILGDFVVARNWAWWMANMEPILINKISVNVISAQFLSIFASFYGILVPLSAG